MTSGLMFELLNVKLELFKDFIGDGVKFFISLKTSNFNESLIFLIVLPS